VRQAFSIWTGYAPFCEENAGVSAEKLAAVVLEPVVGGIEEARARAERLGVEADAELVDEMLEVLVEAWDSCRRGESVGIRGRIRRLEEATERETISFLLRDGATARFYEDEVWPGCFLHESERAGGNTSAKIPGPLTRSWRP
jgi:hypothetical protein